MYYDIHKNYLVIARLEALGHGLTITKNQHDLNQVVANYSWITYMFTPFSVFCLQAIWGRGSSCAMHNEDTNRMVINEHI